MVQLVRQSRSHKGSALTEYGLIVAAVGLGLVAVLVGFRNSVGNVTHRTSVTISQQSGGGYGRRGGGVRPRGGEDRPPESPPEPEDGDSASSSVGSGATAAGVR